MRLEAPEVVASFVERLLRLGLEVWLIGSRANQTAKEASDWDLLVFGSQQLLDSLGHEPPIAAVDLLVVLDGEHFKSPWPREEDGHFKNGGLRQWKWAKLSEDAATYEGSKWIDDQPWDTSRKRAIRVRHCGTAA